jgi:beta-1,4-mannosyl-glycoprotein beta-1,4-N-acetylglucosaminyltransferase
MRKVYDCFTFFNELDLLELRLSECYDSADYFVIAEANKTFSGNAKRFILEDNWDRYKTFHDKIIYIKVDDMPEGPNAWAREYHQRNALIRGLGSAADNDVVALTDCDEVLRPRTLNILQNDTEHSIWICRHPMFYFKLNYLMTQPRSYHVNPMAVLKKNLTSFQNLRNHMVGWAYHQPDDYNTNEVCTIQHSGWHFTYLGDTDHAATKLLNFAHTESQHWASKIDVNEIMTRKGGIDPNAPERFEYIELDNYFPKTVMNNLERWKDYIIADAAVSIKNYVPSLNLDEIYK